MINYHGGNKAGFRLTLYAEWLILLTILSTEIPNVIGTHDRVLSIPLRFYLMEQTQENYEKKPAFLEKIGILNFVGMVLNCLLESNKEFNF